MIAFKSYLLALDSAIQLQYKRGFSEVVTSDIHVHVVNRVELTGCT